MDTDKEEKINDIEELLKKIGIKYRKVSKEELEAMKDRLVPKEELIKQIDERIEYLNKRDELIELGKSLLDITPENEENLKIEELKDDNAIYMYEKLRGGESIIMGLDGSYLLFPSSTDFDIAIEDFRNGTRSN